jgi:hypothetical protein
MTGVDEGTVLVQRDVENGPVQRGQLVVHAVLVGREGHRIDDVGLHLEQCLEELIALVGGEIEEVLADAHPGLLPGGLGRAAAVVRPSLGRFNN